MDQIMLDLETLGTDANAVILSIGAIQFDLNTGKIEDHFMFKVDPQSCLDLGGTVTWSTLKWWMNQDEDAVKSLNGTRISIHEMLRRLTDWIDDIISDEGEVEIWCKGPDFDISIINYYYRQFKDVEPPWKFWNVRDVRTTVKNLLKGKEIEKEVTKNFEGIAHNALDDCKLQIDYTCKIYNLINN